MPRLSKEAHKEYRQYLRMEDGLGDLFDSVREYVSINNNYKWYCSVDIMQVRKCFPQACAKLSETVETFPISGSSPVHLFGGVVFNFNISTHFHRDHKDDTLCLVLVLMDEKCEGGELCLYEPGLVIKARPGDMVIFRSAEVSHFNMHFKGTRASLVFTTDSDFRRWLERRNGWNGHENFSGSFVEGINNDAIEGDESSNSEDKLSDGE